MDHNPAFPGEEHKSALIHHCCQMTGCDDPQVIDNRCTPHEREEDDRPHFGTIRPESELEN